MMGLEPTTFCMAKAGGRLRTFARFAETCRLRGLRASRANASEPERTPNLAILATPGPGQARPLRALANALTGPSEPAVSVERDLPVWQSLAMNLQTCAK
jgi:hypothetical protein